MTADFSSPQSHHGFRSVRAWLQAHNLVLLSMLPLVAPATYAAIERVQIRQAEPRQCQVEGSPAIIAGGRLVLQIRGRWIDWSTGIEKASGIDARVVGRRVSPPMIDLEITARPDARPGPRTIVLDYRFGKDRLIVFVLRDAQHCPP